MMFELRNVESGYGTKQVLFGVSVCVDKGEIVAVVGANGAGKSSILKTGFGLMSCWRGDVLFEGRRVTGSSADRNVARGIAYCPQGHRIFGKLTVQENLQIAANRMQGEQAKASTERAMAVFPAGRSRLRQQAMSLSGGEQQLLALAMAMIPRPRLLLLDEPSLGLAPNAGEMILNAIARLREELGLAVLIVEQKVLRVLDFSDRAYGLKMGRVVFGGDAAALREDSRSLKQIFL